MQLALLFTIELNEANGALGAKLFETGPAFGVDAAGTIHESRKLALAGDADLHVTRGGLVFHYNAYDVAAYASGPTTITLPWAAVSRHVRPDGPLKMAK